MSDARESQRIEAEARALARLGDRLGEHPSLRLPHRVFHVSQRSIRQGRLLAAAQPEGWQFVAGAGAKLAAVYVPALASSGRGQILHGLQALLIEAAAAELSKVRGEVRELSVPGAEGLLYWSAGDRNLLFSVTGADGSGVKFRPVTEPQVLRSARGTSES